MQADVLGKEITCKTLWITKRRYTDYQAVIPQLSSSKFNFWIIKNCSKALSSLTGQILLTIIRNIFSKEKVDELTKSAASLDESDTELIPSPLGTGKRDLYMYTIWANNLEYMEIYNQDNKADMA